MSASQGRHASVTGRQYSPRILTGECPMAAIAVLMISITIALIAPPAVKLFCRAVDRHLDEAFDADLRWF